MMQQKQETETTIFISYAETDTPIYNRLLIHLKQLEQDGFIKALSDQQVQPGSDRIHFITEAIKLARIHLLLISADFLGSEQFSPSEMQQLLERHRQGEIRVIPVITRPCDWLHSSFAHLQCLPRNRKPVTLWDNQEEAFATIAQELRTLVTQQQFPRTLLSQGDRYNRLQLLKRVRATWIEGLLDQSLHQGPCLDLHLQTQPDALENPWRLQVQELQQAPQPLPIGTSITEVYDQEEGGLLILGQPGAGKTTLLLQLARTLLDRAEADEQQPLPVVFNLSSWALKRISFAGWLLDELKTKYRIPPKIGQLWIETRQILPLLDGLDEVAEEARLACIQAVTTYYYDSVSLSGTSLVLCCRTREYLLISSRLPLQRAISILPLTDTQIDAYLSSAQGQLAGLRNALGEDVELALLARRPLMLSIFTLAYQGLNSTQLPIASTPEHLLQATFGIYIEKMLIRRGQLQNWSQEQFLHWMAFLATQLQDHQQTLLSLEELQPDWLQMSQPLYYCSIALIIGLLFGLSVGLVVWGFVGAFVYPSDGQFIGLATGLMSGLFIGLTSSQSKIYPNEFLSWSWKEARRRLFLGLGTGMIGGMIVGQVIGLFREHDLGLFRGQFAGLVTGVISSLVGGLVVATIGFFIGGLSISQHVERIRLVPNEGIRRSGIFGLGIALSFGSPFVLGGILAQWLVGGVNDVLSVGIIGALIGGLAFGMLGGLNAFVRHFVLRFWLWQTKRLPWKLAPFLDEAAERLFLRKMGGSYIFTHRLLLEYFASLGQRKTSKKI